MRVRILLALLVLVPALTWAECPQPTVWKYPGWSERFYGPLGLGNSTTIDDLEIKVTAIFGTSAAKFEVLRYSSPYFTATLVPGDENRIKRDDLIIELHNIFGTNKTNVSIYTPQRANVTFNLTRLETDTGRASLLPTEEFEIEIMLNNTGELGAEDLKILPRFGDFEVLSEESGVITSLCPGEVETRTYRLRTPYRSERFNYTLFFDLEYKDTNVELGRLTNRNQTYPVDLEIAPPILTIERRITNWTLTHQGRVVRVQVTINNTGDLPVYGVNWTDLPAPDLFVIGGTTSWEGNLPEGRVKRFIYEVISEDPIGCIEVSRVTYRDRLGNEYQAISQETTTHFSPNLTVYKSIGSRRWDIQGEKPTITINHTDQVTVEITNVGNAMAKNLLVKEVIKGLETEGPTSWQGDLAPGETVSYSFTVKTRGCNASLVTKVNYSDIDTKALNRSFIDAEGKCACYCTKTLEEVKFDSGETLKGLFPDLNVSVVNGTERKVIPGCIFDLAVRILANASDSVHDVSTFINLDELLASGGRILKGQTEYFQPVLKAKYYPGCSEDRNLTPTNITYDLLLTTPEVDNETSILIPVVVRYWDAYGLHTKNTTVNLTVIPALRACRRVTVAKRDIEIEIDYANEVTLERAGAFNIRIKNTGFSNLENVTLILHNPQNIEVGTNDSRWLGKVEYQVKRANDTLYVYSGEMEINESINVSKSILFPLQMSGTKAGDYTIRYEVRYDGKKATGEVPLRVRGAILKISKELDKTMARPLEAIMVRITVSNIGDDLAEDVVINDYPPAFVQITGRREQSLANIKPGENVTLEYEMRFTEEGSYPIDPAVVTWRDRLGNEYSQTSERLRLDVEGASLEEKPEEVRPGLTSLTPGELVATVVFSVITLGVLFKILSMTRPVS